MIVTNTEERIRALLESTKREGMDTLIGYLITEGFFAAPASTKFHGCYIGGLAHHSLRLRDLVMFHSGLKLDAVVLPGQKPLPISEDNITIATLLHDICKIGAYVGTEKPYKWNKQQPKGHALLSIARIEEHIELVEIEKLMIMYHMGVYGLCEFYEEGSWEFKSSAEYHIRGDHVATKAMSKEESQAFRYGKSLRNAWYHNPICKIMYFCDEIATMEEKSKEN